MAFQFEFLFLSELRGSDPNKYKRKRIVNDKQASAGYMHSGYSIVTHLDVCDKKCAECMFDVARLKKKGTWGLFHEIGHNLQRAEWTFDGKWWIVKASFKVFSRVKFLTAFMKFLSFNFSIFARAHS